MNGDVHVRFCESLKVKFPRATHPACRCRKFAGRSVVFSVGAEKSAVLRSRHFKFLVYQILLNIVIVF